jgi:hypothetical protein
MKGLIRVAALAAIATLTLSLAACGGSSSGGSGSATAAASDGSSTPSTSLSAFDTCLKQHGVTVKPGGFGGGSFSPRPHPSGSPYPHPSGSFSPGHFGGGADSAAYKACEKYAPSGFGNGFGFGAGGSKGVSASALAAFKTCMSSNGVTVTGTTLRQILSSLRSATGKSATAYKTCHVLLESTSATPSPSS